MKQEDIDRILPNLVTEMDGGGGIPRRIQKISEEVGIMPLPGSGVDLAIWVCLEHASDNEELKDNLDYTIGQLEIFRDNLKQMMAA